MKHKLALVTSYFNINLCAALLVSYTTSTKKKKSEMEPIDGDCNKYFHFSTTTDTSFYFWERHSSAFHHRGELSLKFDYHYYLLI